MYIVNQNLSSIVYNFKRAGAQGPNSLKDDFLFINKKIFIRR